MTDMEEQIKKASKEALGITNHSLGKVSANFFLHFFPLFFFFFTSSSYSSFSSSSFVIEIFG